MKNKKNIKKIRFFSKKTNFFDSFFKKNIFYVALLIVCSICFFNCFCNGFSNNTFTLSTCSTSKILNISNQNISTNINKNVNKNLTNNNICEVEHFFTHCLIVNPNKAFSKNNPMSKHYDIDCLTSNEFENILHNFYNKNYCLVNANECYEILNNGQCIKKDIVLKNGKKPLIISIDDVNYDSKKMHQGMADKIAVDKNGKLCSIIDGKYDYEKEFVSVIENFIKIHPDFSHNNAKAMLCLTGYDGILGYRTQNNNKSEIENAKTVVKKLKEKGYYFACHSYGHYHMKNISNEKFLEEVDLWNKEVKPLIGHTSIYVYPYGENEIIKNGEVGFKHKLLLQNGFKLFCGVGQNHFYSYYPFNVSRQNQVLFMDRRSLDGYSLREHQKAYSSFFDCSKVYDNKNRMIKI